MVADYVPNQNSRSLQKSPLWHFCKSRWRQTPVLVIGYIWFLANVFFYNRNEHCTKLNPPSMRDEYVPNLNSSSHQMSPLWDFCKSRWSQAIFMEIWLYFNSDNIYIYLATRKTLYKAEIFTGHSWICPKPKYDESLNVSLVTFL